MENWRPIPNFAGYEASDHGRIRSYWICASGAGRGAKIVCDTPRLMRAYSGKNGRRTLTIGQGSQRCFRQVSALILAAFVGPRPEGMFACHSNGDAGDDRLANLRWDTPKSNSQDMLLHGRHKPNAGSKQGHAVLSIETARQIKSTKGRISQLEWARRIGCSRTTIYNVRAGRSWVTA